MVVSIVTASPSEVVDWGLGAERIAQAGDYVQDHPILLGSQRTGPDLSQEGGEHPDDWHMAHFINPRYTRPLSIMPAFEFPGQRITSTHLIHYVQSLGLKDADRRMERQTILERNKRSRPMKPARKKMSDGCTTMFRKGGAIFPIPIRRRDAGLARGHKIYQDFCLGCHGPIGDGMGPAQPYIYPPPLNFTILKDRGISWRHYYITRS